MQKIWMIKDGEAGQVLVSNLPTAFASGYQIAVWMKNPKGESVAIERDLVSQALYAGFTIDHSKSSASDD